ncbi:family 3 adenylate cyclase [Candidatus Magnetobacterium bavaricum]|uniref:Family 3 adenylate cyclase n=1 Tax=Candidatus Magnetobacterium bavaricum TaxID=29290 RepID=A0A0F3H0E4_9BACT|nr:family 3 adenylate cyclase [Candidatus Magnetobacterium bavaricum]
MAILVIDVVDSISFFDKWGDLEGFQMLQRYGDILIPLITKYGGPWKFLGNRIMICFESTLLAVKTAVEMQKAFKDYNVGKNERQQIHIRVGIDSGKVFEKGNEIFGYAVHVANGVMSRTTADGIFVSSTVYEMVKLRNAVHIKGSRGLADGLAGEV